MLGDDGAARGLCQDGFDARSRSPAVDATRHQGGKCDTIGSMGKPSTKRTRKSRIPAVVPKLVFSTIFVGVVPACVLSACSGGSTLGSSDAAADRQLLGVAQRCFAGSSDPGCSRMGVAAVAFQCFDGSTQPGCPRPVDAAFDAIDDAPQDAGGDADGAG